MLLSFDRAIKDLEEGQISEPVEVESGIYLFRIKKIIPTQVASIDSVKDRITDKIFRDKYRKRLFDWLEKLKKKAYIEVKK